MTGLVKGALLPLRCKSFKNRGFSPSPEIVNCIDALYLLTFLIASHGRGHILTPSVLISLKSNEKGTEGKGT